MFTEKLKNPNMAYLTKTNLKISYEPYRSCKKNSKVVLENLTEYDELVEKNKEVESMLVSALIQFFNPMEVLTLFERITDADLPFLLMDKSASRPNNMILTRISCPHVITMIVRTGVSTRLVEHLHLFKHSCSDKACRDTFLSTAIPTRIVGTAVLTSLV